MGTTFIENVGNKKGSFLKKQETQFQKQVSFLIEHSDVQWIWSFVSGNCQLCIDA